MLLLWSELAIAHQAPSPKPCPDSIAALADALYRGATWLEYTLSKAGNANLQVVRGRVVSKRRLGQGRHQGAHWNPRGERNSPVERLSEDVAPAPRWISARVPSAQHSEGDRCIPLLLFLSCSFNSTRPHTGLRGIRTQTTRHQNLN